MDGLTANQCHGYASRSDGSLGQRRGKCPLPRCWLRATKDQFADFCAGLPPRRERPRHRTAEHTEKCASLHVQLQAQAASACDIRKVPKAEVAASFDHRTANQESRKASQSRHDLIVQANWFARRANQQKPVQPPLQKYFCFS